LATVAGRRYFAQLAGSHDGIRHLPGERRGGKAFRERNKPFSQVCNLHESDVRSRFANVAYLVFYRNDRLMLDLIGYRNSARITSKQVPREKPDEITALINRFTSTLANVERSLRDVHEDRYGTSMLCGGEIPEAAPPFPGRVTVSDPGSSLRLRRISGFQRAAGCLIEALLPSVKCRFISADDVGACPPGFGSSALVLERHWAALGHCVAIRSEEIN
jgi:hypothetical protein